MFPQFVHVMRTHDLHGLSVPSLRILVTSCVSWFLYGIFIGELFYWLPQLVLIPANAYILMKATRWRTANLKAAAGL
jgi:uncharacterized protein with PQ loop repeat